LCPGNGYSKVGRLITLPYPDSRTNGRSNLCGNAGFIESNPFNSESVSWFLPLWDDLERADTIPTDFTEQVKRLGTPCPKTHRQTLQDGLAIRQQVGEVVANRIALMWAIAWLKGQSQ
jgi:hypothetical protein